MKKNIITLILFPALLSAVVETNETRREINHETVLEVATGQMSDVGNGAFSLLGSMSYHYTLLPWLQLGGTAGAGYATGGIGFVGHLAVGPTFNYIYDGNFRNAVFLSSALGVEYQTGDKGHTNGTLSLDLGKRFELFHSVVYRPTVGVLFSSGAYPTAVFTPIAFSAAF